MMKNVEIKAAIRNIVKLRKIIERMELGEAKIIKQHDFFFNSRKGRLKLRKFQNNDGELIFYERTDNEGPKLSTYDKMEINDENFENLCNILGQSLGMLGEVKKTRQLYMFKQTRIHIDHVEGLGNFLELEVTLDPQQSTEEGQRIAESIMAKLEIDSNDLISCAYMDLLNNK